MLFYLQQLPPQSVRQLRKPSDEEKLQNCIAISETETKAVPDNTTSCLPHYQLQWLLNNYEKKPAQFEAKLSIVKTSFLNRLNDTNSRLNATEIEWVARALMLLQTTDWKNVFDSAPTHIRTFVRHQILCVYLDNEIADDTIAVLRGCKILEGDTWFQKLFARESSDVKPANMANVRPAHRYGK